jgi:ATP-binding cassette, subfamily B, multidrug efflux pump
MSTSAAVLRAGGPRKPGVSTWENLRGLWPYLGRYKGAIALGLVTLAIMGLIGVIVPLATGIITDAVAGSARPFERVAPGVTADIGALEWLSNHIPYYQASSRGTLGFYCLVIVACIALKGLMSFLTRWVLIGVSRDIEFDIRSDLLDRLLVMEPEFYVRNRTGELMSRATNDLNAVRMVLGPGIMYTGTTVVTMVLSIAILVVISPSLTLWVLLPVPVVAFAVRHFGKVIHELYEKIQASLATLSAKVQENLSGVRVVRAYAQEDAEIRGFDEPNREYVAKNMELIKTWSMFMPSLTALIGTTFLIVLWQGGYRYLHGQMSLGSLITFNTYLGLLVWPMIALGWVTNIFQRGAASMGRLNYILTAKPQIDNRAARVSPDTRVEGTIEFRNLNFTYPTADLNAGKNGANGHGRESKAVLRNIDLTIPAGSTVAIIGPTGSGKTTLAALIARLWDAPEGTILIDGRPIREWPVETLRRSIGYVPQDTYLFSESVGENIAFGLEKFEPQQVCEAAAIASLDGEVQDFAGQYQTMVGERGVTLSGGQKQRTAIARAVIRDPRILILDDSLSSVDTQTEEKILGQLRGVMRGRTTVLIAHRTSTVRDADQIVVIKDGGIVERGTHEELMARAGYYADLYQKQLLEEELERA